MASYILLPPLRNFASRVARPTTSGRTPLAPGSSVPVCPIRRSPRARRMRATTSWLVGPAGWSMTSRPSIDRAPNLVDEDVPELVDVAVHRAAGRVLVSAAAEFLRD